MFNRYICLSLCMLLFGIGGCSNMRMQTMDEALHQISLSVEANSWQVCKRYNNNEEYRDCMQRSESEFRKARESGQTR